ncbi:UDP-2,4-diacetamido-2,4,6-trideoxy-beta-L-altropyranose hydrolase [Butyrivibrio fibrisolvens]|uniref:UDP-2,4-diacetamido-2,4, 6-trideoxy-beta-L-altropyranose hydrolase n=1 Tax=Butyrivibrio fibrisolvens TaxID=831 RepID=UPI000414011F|nr:UDP-2,4-diacetamido-2,4,6-trideoxy-beta-L-altropyranose hydrolase [Butyrivibrio fibrisolvens]
MKYVRADGNEIIGMGHIMRCEAISRQMWGDEDICFILADPRPAKELSAKGFKTIILDTDYRNMETEIPDLISILNEKHGAFSENVKIGHKKDKNLAKTELLVDSYFITPKYMEELCKHFKVTLVDDLKKCIYPCDKLINYAIYASDMGYEKDYPKTKLLLGPEYAPVRDEFKNIKPIKIGHKINNIMITTGGGDGLHFEKAFVHKLLEDNKHAIVHNKSICWHLIVGPMSKDGEELKKLVADIDAKDIRIHENVTNMASIMKDMDVAIAASGSTLFELCRLGVPTIGFITADNQKLNLEAFSQKAGIKYAGNFQTDTNKTLDSIMDELDKLENQTTRKKLSSKMHSIISKDGFQKSIKQGIGPMKAFFATVIVLLLIIGILVLIIDPFFHYHKPINGFPYIVDNQLSQNPGMATNMIYNSAIVGSSMTVNFNTNDFADIMGLNTIKLSYSGALPRDDNNILSFIYDENSYSRKQNGVDAIFMVIDPNVMTADINATKYELPTYLYDNNVFNDIQYLYNKDVLFQYILKPTIQRQGSDLSTIYYSWWTPEYYNEQWVMHNYYPAEYNEEELDADAFLPQTAQNLEVNFLPYIKEHQETTFYIFFAPYSVLYWYDVMQDNNMEATIAQVQLIANTLLEYDNVRLFDFMDNEEIITDLSNYADTIHYKPEYNAWMVRCFNSGEEEIFKDDIEADMNKLREIVKNYDYESLFARYPK